MCLQALNCMLQRASRYKGLGWKEVLWYNYVTLNRVIYWFTLAASVYFYKTKITCTYITMVSKPRKRCTVDWVQCEKMNATSADVITTKTLSPACDAPVVTSSDPTASNKQTLAIKRSRGHELPHKLRLSPSLVNQLSLGATLYI